MITKSVSNYTMKSLNLESLETMGDYEWMDRIRAGKQFSPSIKVGKLLLH